MTGVDARRTGRLDPDLIESRRRRIATQDSVRFGIVLLLLLTTFVFLSAAPTGSWPTFVSTVLQGATMIAAFRASRTEQRWLRIAYVVVGLSIVVAAMSLFVRTENSTDTLYVLNALLVLTAPIAIVRGTVRRRRLDVQTVLGALCVYVLIGMVWAFAYAAVGGFSSGPFFSQTAHATTADYLYFSYVTLTTVGYGDLTAVGGLGRSAAVLEALLGQLYLVTVVALVISNLGRRGQIEGGQPQ